MKKGRDKAKRNITIMGIIIVVIMIGSTLGITLRSSDEGSSYNGFKFTNTQNGGWVTKINGKEINFYYHPGELESVNISKEFINQIKETKAFYITFDSNITDIQYLEVARFDIVKNLQEYSILEGISKPDSIYPLPIINCDNATQAIPVIYFIESKERNMSFEDNCYTVEAYSGFDFLVFRDKLLYILLGVQEV